MQSLRKDRAETIQSTASDTRNALHLPDGPEQEARDRLFGAKPGKDTKNPDKWSDSSWQEYAWGTDVRQDSLNYISTVQPFAIGNMHRPLLTQPWRTFPFVQAPRTHGPPAEVRYRPLTSDVPLSADKGQLGQTLPQPVSRYESHKTFGLQANTDNWSSHSIMETSPTLETSTNPHGRQHTGRFLRMRLRQTLLRSPRGIFGRLLGVVIIIIIMVVMKTTI